VRRRVRIEVVGIVLNEPSKVMVKLTDVLDDGQKSDVFGVGSTPNEAARAAFQHAADLMFPATERSE
jgi:hypothetical protein